MAVAILLSPTGQVACRCRGAPRAAMKVLRGTSTRTDRRITDGMVMVERTARRRSARLASKAASSHATFPEPPEEKVVEEEKVAASVETEMGKSSNPEDCPPPSPPSLFARVRGFFSGGKLDKERLKSLGSAALLSYGAVSNLTYMTCVIIAWVITGKRTGMSPLAEGNWPAFLAVYAAFFALQNIIRPIRFSVSIAFAPVLEKLRNSIQARFKTTPRISFIMTVCLVNICGTISYLVGGLILATTIAQVPLLP